MQEIGGQIIESTNEENVIRTLVKDEKEWQDWLQDFQLKSNSAWILRNTFPSRSRATFRKDYVCQHSYFNKSVHSSKRSKNTVCKAKLLVKIKPITTNTKAKDKYVNVGMINTYFSWLGALIIRLTETISAR
jgi:coenzyme F420-reducing hydrogenase alpha subunit